MDGILLINKEVNMTSRDAVNKVCKIFNTKKVGHTGTLDPFADGLLVITLNKGTKCGQFLEEQTKTYVATLKLGSKTDTMDTEGQVIEEKEIPLLTEEMITKVLDSFKGDIIQQVPLYSAIKINGKKLYEYARNNEKVECPKRQITIHDIKLLAFNNDTIKFEVTCSKGTYIRVLGNDIATSLNTVGHLINLKRTRVGNFLLENASSLDEVNDSNVISLYDALKDSFKTIEADDKLALDIKNGKHLPFDIDSDRVFICDKAHNPIAIIERDHGKIFKVVRGLF